MVLYRMDIDTTSALAIVSVILGVVSNIIHLVNHTRFKSTCMGKEISGSLDISRIEIPSP